MSTVGYEPEPTDVEALLANLCGDILAEPDLLVRYTMLSKEQVLYDALVSRLKAERGKVLAELVVEERKTRPAIAAKQAVAEAAGLRSRQRVEQLIASARD